MIRAWWVIAGPLYIYVSACSTEVARVFPYYLKQVLKSPACFLGFYFIFLICIYIYLVRREVHCRWEPWVKQRQPTRCGPPGIHSIHIPPERGSGKQLYFPWISCILQRSALFRKQGIRNAHGLTVGQYQPGKGQRSISQQTLDGDAELRIKKM